LERRSGQRTRLAAEVERQTIAVAPAGALRGHRRRSRGGGAERPRAPHPDVRAMTIRARCDRRARPSAALFEEAEARAARDRVDRSPFLLFHAALDVEACVPVRAASAGARRPDRSRSAARRSG